MYLEPLGQQCSISTYTIDLIQIDRLYIFSCTKFWYNMETVMLDCREIPPAQLLRINRHFFMCKLLVELFNLANFRSRATTSVQVNKFCFVETSGFLPHLLVLNLINKLNLLNLINKFD